MLFGIGKVLSISESNKDEFQYDEQLEKFEFGEQKGVRGMFPEYKSRSLRRVKIFQGL